MTLKDKLGVAQSIVTIGAVVVGWLDEDRLLLRRGTAYDVVKPRGGTPAATALPEDGQVLIRRR